jgi:LacI family transcriptional regulator
LTDDEDFDLYIQLTDAKTNCMIWLWKSTGHCGGDRLNMTSAENLERTSDLTRPLYRQVEAYVRRQIRQGELVPGNRLDPNDLARQTNISRPVVQQALQSLSSQGVLVRRPRSGTYVADNATQHMSKSQKPGASQSLALIVPQIQIPEFARLAHGTDEAARARGLDLLIAGTDNSVERYEHAIRRHLQSPVFGLILVPPIGVPLPLSLLDEIEASDVPTVCCYRRAGDERWPVVVEDGEHTGRIVAEHLIQTGRRRLCFVNLHDPSPTGANFFHGFSRTVMQHLKDVDEVQELDISEDVDIHHWKTNDHLLPIIRNFIEAHPRLDGFFCGSDLMADAVHHVLQDMGRSIPQDAAVIGNGGNVAAYATFSRQGITTVDYSYQRFGEELLKQVTSIRDGHRASVYEPVYIRGELRIQSSSVSSQ